jgi:sugar fermentation stimulation protein A
MNNTHTITAITIDNIIKATLHSRPNRFTGIVQLPNNTTTKAYIPNPGRMSDFMNKGSQVLLRKTEKHGRKTKFDLIAVKYQGELVSIDSRLPNRLIHKALNRNTLRELNHPSKILPEHTFGSSRIDFYLEKNNTKYLIEVKSCTLVEKGVALFPDAPTTRGQRHLQELISAAAKGYHPYIIFVVQRSDAQLFKPNKNIDPEFARLMSIAAKKGVTIQAYTCNITEERDTSCLKISLNNTIPFSVH